MVVQALCAWDGALLLGLRVQGACTELRRGSGGSGGGAVVLPAPGLLGGPPGRGNVCTVSAWASQAQGFANGG